MFATTNLVKILQFIAIFSKKNCIFALSFFADNKKEFKKFKEFYGMKTIRVIIRYSLFIILTQVFSKVFAQGVITFSSDQGLSNTCIFNIFQDSNKNVWISTMNGLNRWDGVKMNVYRHDEGKAYSLLSNTTTVMLEQDRDNILIGTRLGLQRYNYPTDRFEPVPMLLESGDTVNPRIIAMASFRAGEIHITTSGFGNYVLDINEGIAHFSDKYAFTNDNVQDMLEDRFGNVWAQTRSHGLYMYSDGKGRCVTEKGFVSICEGLNGVYAATEQGDVYRLSGTEGDILHTIYQTRAVVTKIRSDKKGTIMICTDGNGLMYLNEETGQVSRSGVRSLEYDLSRSNVKDVLLDADDNLWIGVYWKGVVVQPAQTSTFGYIGRRAIHRNTIGTNCVTSMLPARDGGMWVATDHQGLYHISTDGTTGTHYDSEVTQNVPSTITAMYEDKDGVLWLGSPIGGLVKKTGTQFIESGLNIKHIYAITADKHGNMWIGTSGDGIYCCHAEQKTIDHYTSHLSDPSDSRFRILRNIWVFSLAVKDDWLFAGTADGVELFHIGNDGILQFVDRYTNQSTVNVVKVTDEDLWLGASNGLVHATLEAGKLNIQRVYTQQDGLANNVVNAIENGWLSTDNGLSHFSREDGTFTNYYAADGLQGNEFSRGASAVVGDSIYFGGINGITFFEDREFGSVVNSEGSGLRLVDLFINNTAMHMGDKSGSYVIMNDILSRSNEINLCAADNTFSIDVSTMALTYPYVTYEYRLNGGEWRSTAHGQQRIYFAKLSPGRYDIEIRVKDNDSYEPVRLKVHIHHPWYATWWACIIWVVMLFVLTYIMWIQYKGRLDARRVIRQHQQDKLVNEMRTKFFMDISHEIRTPMTLIMSPLEKLRTSLLTATLPQALMEDCSKNIGLIKQNSERIMTLINQLMDVRKIEKGQFPLKYEKIELIAFLSNLYNLFSENALGKHINFTFQHDLDEYYCCVDSQNLDKIVMNLLSNAFKFTPEGGQIELKTWNLDRKDENPETDRGEVPQFCISVTDTGIGIPDVQKKHVFERFFSSASGTGIGLNLAYMLVQLHKGQITVSDNPAGNGTCFTLTMPQALNEIQNTEIPEIQVAENKGVPSTVLIVEDDEAIRQYVAEELAAVKIRTYQCSNGEEGWNYILQNVATTGLVITDVMMPLMDGFELCKRIKTNYNTNHLPVVMLTAKVTDQERIEGLETGADAYVTKPFSMDVLITRVKTLMENRRMLMGKYVGQAHEQVVIEKREQVSPDEHLLQRIMNVVNDELSNENLSIELIADKVGVSRVHLHRKLKELTGQTPRDFLKGIRLRKAAEMLKDKDYDITAVSDAVGFKSVSTFSAVFKQIYGVSPSEYKKG